MLAASLGIPCSAGGGHCSQKCPFRTQALSLSGHEHITWVSGSPQALPTPLVRFWPADNIASLAPKLDILSGSPEKSVISGYPLGLQRDRADNAHASSLHLVLPPVPWNLVCTEASIAPTLFQLLQMSWPSRGRDSFSSALCSLPVLCLSSSLTLFGLT